MECRKLLYINMLYYNIYDIYTSMLYTIHTRVYTVVLLYGIYGYMKTLPVQ